MNDITEIFSRVAPPSPQGPSPEIVDADLARGRHALARRRRDRRARIAAAGTAAVVAAAAVAFGANRLDESNSSNKATSASTTSGPVESSSAPTTVRPRPTAPAVSLPVRLIAYTGPQLAGFTVDRVPQGWRLSAVSQYALTIDPQGDTNNNPDVFEGKLTVLLQSQSVSGLPAGQAASVNGHAGVITDDGGQALTYNDGSGHTVVVQAPDQLRWSSAQIVSFAEGVHVTANAIAGVG
jgi:hypothetical protein